MLCPQLRSGDSVGCLLANFVLSKHHLREQRFLVLFLVVHCRKNMNY